ncbi:universal stress protein [Latilactobacillus curvatus]|uniref:universal stress protein n=1 Tax=Latilactobacillus curvatus TaxID=28038 RepID=UPI0010ADABBC|nr:universal stress protein [Latilactobacillus curvatus]TJY25390.1 universal stress protein [Latilactobacillus curvatus]
MVQEYKRILVPVDGSEEAELALNKAVWVAKMNQARLDILNVLDTKQFAGSYSGMLSGDAIFQISEDAQNYLNSLKYDIQTNDGLKDVEIHVRFGNPKNVIARDFPTEYQTDLIMMGSTGLNAIERMLMGSVTEYVNRTAICDVLIVKTDVENRPYQKASKKK